jgi:hypothetical protein
MNVGFDGIAILFCVFGVAGFIVYLYFDALKNRAQRLSVELKKANERASEVQVKCTDAEARCKDSEIRSDKAEKDSAKNTALVESLLSDGKLIASLYADFKTLEFELAANHNSTKARPAPSRAENIRLYRDEAKETVQQMREMQYRWEALITTFPDIEPYVDSLETIRELSDYTSADDLEKKSDRTRQFLSKEEYQNLPEVERNQLALGRYIAGGKSKWQIGRDYEMYIANEYEQVGWHVERIGIELKLEDMGRDVIARRNNTTQIVQVKYWAQFKQIHENSICQLYGTTMHYAKNNPLEKVIPVFVTNIELSERASEFAQLLGVKVRQGVSMGEFPRVKCNINQATKEMIYHLPMDQLYDRTKIDSNGEFFAMTVAEAEAAGFRRALRWRG